MAIKHWPETERPRERLLQSGATALSDAELLAIFLRIGCKGLSAVDLARNLLVEFGDIQALLKAPYHIICQQAGLGPAKYAQLQAIKELGLRLGRETLRQPQNLNSSQQVGKYLCQHIGHYEREVFAVLLLDSQHRLICLQEMFFGTIDRATVHPREVVKVALKYNAVAIIFAHNHPSGVAEPSGSDRLLTKTLIDALALVDIKALDHLVVGQHQWVSFADRGWM